MKKIAALFMALTLTLNLCACTAAQPEAPSAEESQAPTWQEQYDLGVRYLSEGNYQEAIIAFTAAIEIDPKQAPAYVGRGDAYVLSEGTESNLTAAKVDYERAIELDEASAEAYLGLADVYIRQGDYEKALEILQMGLEKTGGNQTISDKIIEIDKLQSKNEYGSTIFTRRDSYLEFENMSTEWQSLLGQILTGVVNDDTEALIHILQEVDLDPLKNQSGGYTFFYTMWRGYKVHMLTVPDHVNENGDRIGQFNITLRPKNGTGIYCEIYYNCAMMTEGRENWFDYFYYTTYITCECVDWQWNGSCKSFEQINYLWCADSGVTNLTAEETTVTGTMKDSLKVGTFTQVTNETTHWKPYGNTESYQNTTVLIYQDGRLVEKNGEAVESEGISLLGESSSTSITKEVLEWLYW